MGTLKNVYLTDFSILRDEQPMVTCTLQVDGTDYDCAEYVESDGSVCNSADAHMSVNGIHNRKTQKSEKFVVSDMDDDDFVRWVNIAALVRESMQTYVDECFDVLVEPAPKGWEVIAAGIDGSEIEAA